MTPNSLPGFLRRTIRNDSDDEDCDDNAAEQHGHIQSKSDAVGSPASKSLMVNHSNDNDGNMSTDYSTSNASQDQDHGDSDGDGGHDSNYEHSVPAKIDISENFHNTETMDHIGRKFRMMATPTRTRTSSKDIHTRTHTYIETIGNTASLKNNSDVNVNVNVTAGKNKISSSYSSSLDNKVPSNNAAAVAEGSTLNADSEADVDDLDGGLKSGSAAQTTFEHSSSTTNTAGEKRDTGISTSSSGTMCSTSASAPKKNYKELQFDKIMSSPIIDIDALRQIAWNGIPTEHRPQIWKILLGYLPTNTARRPHTLKRKRSEYRDAIAQHYDISDHSRTTQEQETLRQVLVDVPRTAPDVPLFRNDMIRQSLARLLYIWAMRHPASSYVQGINDLATPLIAVFLGEYFKGDVLQGEELEDLTPEILHNVEADVYWCLTNLLSGIQDHYTQDQPGVQRMVMKLEELVKRIDAGLTSHLENTGVMFMQFAFRWMNCLLLREFNLTCIIRLWDTYLSEGDGGFETFHVYVCASFLCQFSVDLQGMQFDELFAFMQNIPTNDWDDSKVEVVLSQAFVLSTLFQGSDAHLTSSSPAY